MERGSAGRLSPRQRQLRSEFARAMDGASRTVRQREAVSSARRRLPVRRSVALPPSLSRRPSLCLPCTDVLTVCFLWPLIGGAQRV